jgi:hypothetical protein
VSLRLNGPLKGLDDLTTMRCCWDFGYTINCLNGWWSAVKKQDVNIFFEAKTAEELNVLIRNDYYHR